MLDYVWQPDDLARPGQGARTARLAASDRSPWPLLLRRCPGGCKRPGPGMATITIRAAVLRTISEGTGFPYAVLSATAGIPAATLDALRQAAPAQAAYWPES